MVRRPSPRRSTKPARPVIKSNRAAKSTATRRSRSVVKVQWPNIQWLIEGGGNITLGSMGPVACAATASDDDICYAMLQRRRGESLGQLMQRLDHSIEIAAEDNVPIDEINSPTADD